MEDSNAVQDPQNPVPTHQQPPQEMAPPPPSQAADSRKRALDIDPEENAYFKMRSILNEMRPQILEVLRTQDFQNCSAAHEVREKLDMLMELYKKMNAETVTRSIAKPKITRESNTFSGENEAGQKPQEQLQNGKQQAGELENPAHITGGSAFGWNFITFPGNEPVYYGRTKESFRAVQVTSTSGA